MFRIVHDRLAPAVGPLLEGRSPDPAHGCDDVVLAHHVRHREIQPGAGKTGQVLHVGVGAHEHAVAAVGPEVLPQGLAELLHLFRIRRPLHEPPAHRGQHGPGPPVALHRIVDGLELVVLGRHPLEQGRSVRGHAPLGQGVTEQSERHRQRRRDLTRELPRQVAHLGGLGPDPDAGVLRPQFGRRQQALGFEIHPRHVDGDLFLGPVVRLLVLLVGNSLYTYRDL